MKAIILICGILLMASQVQASTLRMAQEISQQREVKTYQYRLKTGLMSSLVFNMGFGKAETISDADLRLLRSVDVFQVDLVFSDFPNDVNHEPLNLRRIKFMERMRKDLVSDYNIEWKLVRQMACKNESEAKIMFHGIVVHYRPVQTEEVMEADLSFMGSFLPKEEDLGSTKDIKKLKNSYPDTTIFSVLNRNKSWKNMTIVADLTGSMSPYVGQLILWFKLNINQNRVNNVVFFNDGNMTPDRLKRIGSTGGIYDGEATTYADLRELAIKTISSGYGGDGPENDCEALIEAVKRVPKSKELVLIADNLAPIKDYELLDKIKVPVHVVLCGSSYGVNLQYMNLARRTGGSIHSMEKDLENLITLNEGKVFIFLGKKYKIENDLIIEVREG
ncbi:MAG: hypothetical protein QNK23_16605 [Crocinitomicaceae bacterium]|nr:hypothetical protein [Crocinitomicaceae bacterium]